MIGRLKTEVLTDGCLMSRAECGLDKCGVRGSQQRTTQWVSRSRLIGEILSLAYESDNPSMLKLSGNSLSGASLLADDDDSKDQCSDLVRA